MYTEKDLKIGTEGNTFYRRIPTNKFRRNDRKKKKAIFIATAVIVPGKNH